MGELLRNGRAMRVDEQAHLWYACAQLFFEISTADRALRHDMEYTT
jgi:hypothetical protein